jgi:hypothetical protein
MQKQHNQMQAGCPHCNWHPWHLLFIVPCMHLNTQSEAFVSGCAMHLQLTNFIAQARPAPLRGGILADDMGLGKTLQVGVVRCVYCILGAWFRCWLCDTRGLWEVATGETVCNPLGVGRHHMPAHPSTPYPGDLLLPAARSLL